MSGPVIDRVRQAASDVFGVPLDQLSSDSSPQTLEAWDSVGHLNLVLALEQSFGVQFSPEEIAAMTSVRLAADVLIRKDGGVIGPVPSPADRSEVTPTPAPADRFEVTPTPAPAGPIGKDASPSSPDRAQARAAGLTIRATTPEDLAAVVELLSERDGRPLAREDVSIALFGLQPEHVAGWLALMDGEPVGVSMLFIRPMRWEGRTLRVGYWAHLFVRESARRLGVYPQLVLGMMNGIHGLGIDAILAATRRRHVARGHVQLGFARLGELPVLFEPLRPFRLLARYKGWPAVAAVGAPGDALYGAWRKRRRPAPPAGWQFREIDAGGPDLEAVVAVLNDAGSDRVSQVWSTDSLRRRLAGTIDGGGYTILAGEHLGRWAGAVIWRIAPRERVLAGVVMDIVAPAAKPEAHGVLLAEAERRIGSAGADTILYLDGLGPSEGRLLRAAGHLVSDETYNVLVWPKTLVPAESTTADLSRWRFGFLDHDAF